MILVQKKYVCPICSNEMGVKHLHDGVDILICTSCKSEVHFGSWEVQRAIIDSEVEYETLKKQCE